MSTSNTSFTPDPRWLAAYLLIGTLILIAFVAVPAWRMSHNIAHVIDGRVHMYQPHPPPLRGTPHGVTTGQSQP
jgi:hypothetical protein